jgi:hypothetical protein
MEFGFAGIETTQVNDQVADELGFDEMGLEIRIGMGKGNVFDVVRCQLLFHSDRDRIFHWNENAFVGMRSELANSFLVSNALGMEVAHISIGLKSNAIDITEEVWNRPRDHESLLIL